MFYILALPSPLVNNFFKSFCSPQVLNQIHAKGLSFPISATITACHPHHGKSPHHTHPARIAGCVPVLWAKSRLHSLSSHSII